MKQQPLCKKLVSKTTEKEVGEKPITLNLEVRKISDKAIIKSSVMVLPVYQCGLPVSALLACKRRFVPSHFFFTFFFVFLLLALVKRACCLAPVVMCTMVIDLAQRYRLFLLHVGVGGFFSPLALVLTFGFSIS